MDTQLVIRAQGGDEAAFDAVVDAAYGRLQQVAYRILRDPQLAEDATQQALVRIWRKLPRLNDPAKFDAWSYRLLVNACSDEARKTSRSLPNLSFSTELAARSDMETVDDRDQLERGFRRLSIEQRAVVVLHHYVGLPVGDVADALGIPAGTAHSRLDRAMAKLRMVLHADDPTTLDVPQEVAR